VEGELLDAERWTDMTKLIVAFCNFANAPKMTHTGYKTCIYKRLIFSTY